MSNGNDTLAKAQKKATSGGGLFGFGPSLADRMDEARELYRQAANEFKLQEQWKDSGDAFCQAAECSIKADADYDAAIDYWDAAKSYKKSNPTLSVAALRKSIEIHVRKGKFRTAADRSKDIGQIFATDDLDLEGALEAYEQAGKWYDTEESPALANACFKEAADVAIKLDKYSIARGMLEQVATRSLNNPLTRFSAKDYFFKAGLCSLCEGDSIAASRSIGEYAAKDPSFIQQREHKFLEDITSAVEGGDQQAFTNCVQDFDSISRLDELKTKLLLTIKRGILEEPDML